MLMMRSRRHVPPPVPATRSNASISSERLGGERLARRAPHQVGRRPQSANGVKLTIRVRAPSSPALGIMYVRGVCYHVFVYSTRESTLLLRVRLLNKRCGVVSYVCSPHTHGTTILLSIRSLNTRGICLLSCVRLPNKQELGSIACRLIDHAGAQTSSIACLLTGRTGALIDRLQAVRNTR